jgi:hypothetical protein
VERAKRPARLPLVLTRDEVHKIFAPRPASFQKDSMICAPIRLAAVISLVPVQRKMTRLTPLTVGDVNRTYQSFLPAGGWLRKNFRVVQRTGMSNLRSFFIGQC